MAEKRYVLKESTIKAIIDLPRSILNIDEEEYKFPPTEFPNIISSAVDYASSTSYQGGFSLGHNEGYNEGYDYGYNEGESAGKLELVQSSESLQTAAIGTSLVIDDISPIGHELDIRVVPKNYFDISAVVSRKASTGSVTNNRDGTLSIVTTGGNYQGNKPNTLKDYAPNLEIGKEYTLFMNTDGQQRILLSNEVTAGVGYFLWNVNSSLTMTQHILESTVFWYVNPNTGKATISDIKIIPTNYLTNLPIVNIDVSDNEGFDNSVRYTSNADGTLDKITSIYPVTYISSDIAIDDITLECSYVKDIDTLLDSGKQMAYDEFWDNYQLGSNGKPKTSYQYAFASGCWNDTTFKPKYDLILGTGYSGIYMFWSNGVKNLKETLQKLGLVLDTSKSQYMGNAFQTISSIALPKIDLSNADLSTAYCFSSPNIVTIDEIVFSEKTNIATSTFNNAKKLTSVLFSGIIAKNIDLHWSTLLNKASIVSLFNTLSTTTTGQTATISKTAVNKAFETSEGAADGSTSEEWLALTGTRTNWTIAFA